MKKLLVVAALLLVSNMALADLVPTGNGGLYYRMGGGQNLPQPSNYDTQSLSLNAQGQVGLGYNCGVFNPKLSIMNSMNGIENSFMNMSSSVVHNAGSAILEFPMYEVAKDDPNLYQFLTNGLYGSRADLQVATRDCQQMQQMVGNGQDPYTHWMTMAVSGDWQDHMHGANADASDSGSDIEQVNKTVAQDDGKEGVPWVNGSNKNGTIYAGGSGQAPIQVIYDTVVAGYNVSLQDGRAYNDTSAPPSNGHAEHLTQTWATPVIAAKWVVNVVGDMTVTTYSGGQKGATPGVGLIPSAQALATSLTTKLQDLVTGQTQPTLDNLKAVSAPGVAINQAVIARLQQETPVNQSMLVTKLAQESASAQIIDEALLARELLQVGSQIPAIYSNQPAQATIKRANDRLTQAINDVMFNNQVRKQLLSNTISQLMSDSDAKQQYHNGFQTLPKSVNVVDGAVPNAGTHP